MALEELFTKHPRNIFFLLSEQNSGGLDWFDCNQALILLSIWNTSKMETLLEEEVGGI